MALSFAANLCAGADYDQRPVPLKTPPPDYPSQMMAQKKDGMVVVLVKIDESGSVDECEISKSTDANFDAYAIKAVKGWKFKPATKAGVPVSAKLMVPIKFDHEA